MLSFKVIVFPDTGKPAVAARKPAGQAISQLEHRHF
jgi:hypothetical protein